MPQPRHLRSAPITEALFDIRVKSRSGFDVSQFSSLRPQLAGRFPKVDERRGGQFTLQFPPTAEKPPAIEDLGLQGFFFKSQDEKLIAQFRIDGFTLNKLKPYSSWDELLPSALELWHLYYSTSMPEAVTRLALRYINHIPLPYDRVNFNDFLRAAPQIPPELPQVVGAFFSRVTILDPQALLSAHVVQALEANPAQKGVTVILDIDAFREVDIPPDDPAVRDHFRELRDFKNVIFFNHLTEVTLNLFE